jgi:hypothetical protein
MNRIFEFIPSPEEAVVSRALMLVHQAMDQHLPSASTANRQFTKTVLSVDSERTAAHFVGPDAGSTEQASGGAFGSYEDTSPVGRVPLADDASHGAPTHGSNASAPASAPKPAVRPALAAANQRAPDNKAGPLWAEDTQIGVDHGADWVTRITLVLLLAGLILLAYVVAA